MGICSSRRMRYVAAYLLAVLGGNDKPSESDIKKILSSVGIDADPSCLKKVISELKDKNLDELLAAGDCYILYQKAVLSFHVVVANVGFCL